MIENTIIPTENKFSSNDGESYECYGEQPNILPVVEVGFLLWVAVIHYLIIYNDRTYTHQQYYLYHTDTEVLSTIPKVKVNSKITMVQLTYEPIAQS